MNDMTDQEKSVLLAKAIGLEVMKSGYGDPDLWRERSGKLRATNMYRPANMALAWRVLNWATDYPRKNNEEMCMWWEDALLHNYAPADAQRLWLDKILDLAIEAGLITPATEPGPTHRR